MTFEEKLINEFPFDVSSFNPLMFRRSLFRENSQYRLRETHQDYIQVIFHDTNEVVYSVDYFLTSGRLFAPSSYIVRHGTIDWLRWRFTGKRHHSVFNYWRMCFEKHPEYFNIKSTGDGIFRINSIHKIPYPSTINYNTKMLTWKLNDKRVAIREYFRFWECQYINVLPVI